MFTPEVAGAMQASLSCPLGKILRKILPQGSLVGPKEGAYYARLISESLPEGLLIFTVLTGWTEAEIRRAPGSASKRVPGHLSHHQAHSAAWSGSYLRSGRERFLAWAQGNKEGVFKGNWLLPPF